MREQLGFPERQNIVVKPEPTYDDPSNTAMGDEL